MLSSEGFNELMLRVRTGDADAAAELIRECEPDIRLEVRVRMRIQDGRVRRLLDSMDVTQSVLASFFVGVAAGRYNPESPQQLLGLLVTMARNKLLNQVRHHRQQRRDVRRAQALGGDAEVLQAPGETPSEVLSGKELLAEAHKRLTMDEQQLAERRRRGQSWSSIADELGGTADGRRKQFERAFARVARELDLE